MRPKFIHKRAIGDYVKNVSGEFIAQGTVIRFAMPLIVGVLRVKIKVQLFPNGCFSTV